MSDEVSFTVSFPLDSEGFLRRECPSCRREFKWLPQDETDPMPDEGYCCPYCGGDSSLGDQTVGSNSEPDPQSTEPDQERRAKNRERHAQKIDEKIASFLSNMRGIDQPFYVHHLVSAVDDPKFDERSAHQVLDQLVEAGRVERQRGPSGDEHWAV
jgi:hypothetical protein